MTEQPLSLTWLCFIRDHGVDLKVSKEARVLASVLPTYGQGKKIFVSMVSLSKVTGMKRETVRNARQELEDKFLLEDITGKPKDEQQERTYRLTMPGYVVPESATPKVVLERTTPGPLEDHPLVPERTTPGPLEDHNIKSEIKPEINTYINITGEAGSDDVGGEDSPKAKSKADDGAVAPRESDWVGSGKDVTANRAWLAGLLGVPVGSIGSPLWRFLDGLGLDASGSDVDAITDAAEASAGKRNPVGFFQRILPGRIEAARADAASASAADAERQRQEEEDARAEAERQAEADRKRAEREAAKQSRTDAIWAGCEPLRGRIEALGYGFTTVVRDHLRQMRDAEPVAIVAAVTEDVVGEEEKQAATKTWLGRLPGVKKEDADHTVKIQFNYGYANERLINGKIAYWMSDRNRHGKKLFGRWVTWWVGADWVPDKDNYSLTDRS